MPVVASASAPVIMVEDSPFQSFTQPFNQDLGRLRVDEQLERGRTKAHENIPKRTNEDEGENEKDQELILWCVSLRCSL